MYALISKNQNAIIGGLDPTKDVQRYEWLVSNVAQCNAPNYQDEYKKFWQMSSLKGLTSGFYQAYFNSLSPAKPIPPLRGLCETLYQFPRQQGGQALQFSFATKLRHMLNRQLPIYDYRVARFYLFQTPSTDVPVRQRINGLIVFHNFLNREYKRLLGSGLLAKPIDAFKMRFNNPPQHTDVKIIDWLIYGFVQLADKGKIKC